MLGIYKLYVHQGVNCQLHSIVQCVQWYLLRCVLVKQDGCPGIEFIVEAPYHYCYGDSG